MYLKRLCEENEKAFVLLLLQYNCLAACHTSVAYDLLRKLLAWQI